MTSEGAGARWASRVARVAANGLFAYGSIALLQLHTLRGIGGAKDLTTGDTASYFEMADGFANERSVSFAWSPLYTSYYGTALRLLGDAYAATVAHRVVAVLVLTLVLLAVARRFLDGWVAWAVAAWWAHLPIVYDALYEIHVFGAIPVLVAVLVAASGAPTPLRRGATLAVLGASSVLVRNELLIAVVVVTLASLIFDRRRDRSGEDRRRAALQTYALPLAAVAAVTVVAYSASVKQGADLRDGFRRKHTLNMCQIYAYSVQQRGGDFDGSPWTECQQLMLDDFGTAEPSLVEAVRSNPGAVAAFVAWNVRLLPEGLQVGLFDATSGSANPDYAPVRTGRWAAGAAGLLVVAVLAASAWTARSQRAAVRSAVLARWWPFTVAAAVVATTLFVALSQRPRPSYLFPLTSLLLVAIGAAAQLLARRARLDRWLSCAVPVALVLLLVLVPPHFRTGPRPVLTGFRALQPQAHALSADGAVLVASGYGELCSYVAPNSTCSLQVWRSIHGGDAVAADVARTLDRVDASVVYADAAMLGDPAVTAFIDEAPGHGWDVVGRSAGPEPYVVLVRVAGDPEASSSSQSP